VCLPVPRKACVTAASDYLFSGAGVLIICVAVVILDRACVHWFLLSAAACGILAGVDVVRCIRGRLDLFDPLTLIGCLAFYGYFLAPILHVVWDQYGVGNEMFLWGDWRPWLGGIAALNACGLGLYRMAQRFAYQRSTPSRKRWRIERIRFYPLSFAALGLSIGGVWTFFWQFDGFQGMVDAFETNQQAFAGKGWLLIFAWPLAVLSYVTLAVLTLDRRARVRQPVTLALILVSLFGIAHFLLMGWYGSRSATVWALFWMLGIVHYQLRRLSKKTMMLGVVFLLGFMYFYGFYKERGRAGFEVLRAPAMWLEPSGYERDIKYLMLGDLARADSNALILHNLVKDPGDYEYRWGLTYLGALTLLVPRKIWKDRPEFRVDAGTEAQHGKAVRWSSSRLYGLGGEAMLNFGPAGVPLVFLVFGAVVGWYRRQLAGWAPHDSRLLLAPFLTLLIVGALVYDSDVLIYFCITEGLLVSLLLFAASRRCRIRNGLASPAHA
jgi:hypothetical protein